jgi:acyl carrier protein
MTELPEPLEARLKEIRVRRLRLERSADSITDDELLFDPAGLGLDSIDALEFVLGIEQELGVQVGNEEVAGEVLGSIGKLAAYLNEQHPDLSVASG